LLLASYLQDSRQPVVRQHHEFGGIRQTGGKKEEQRERKKRE